MHFNTTCTLFLSLLWFLNSPIIWKHERKICCRIFSFKYFQSKRCVNSLKLILKINKIYQTGVLVVILQKCFFFQLWVLKPDQSTDKGPISSQFLNSLHSFKKEILIARRKSKDSSIHFPSYGVWGSYTIIQRWEEKEQVYSRTVPSITLGHSGLYFSFKTTDKKKKKSEKK